MGIRVINGGMLSTIQDMGRVGFMRYGVGRSGAADKRSLAIANLLVGNSENVGAIEFTLAPPTLEFTSDCTVAVTGGEFAPLVNGSPVSGYHSLYLRRGDTLSFGGRVMGLRGYIAFSGGLDLPKVMGSVSTSIKNSLGGFKGRALKSGDEIAFTRPTSAFVQKAITPELFTDDVKTLRVVLGMQSDAFTDEGLHNLFSTVYTVTPNSDRMGCRLKGGEVHHKDSADIISDAIVEGAIQIPSDKQPIVMLADHQTTGGYTKPGAVITADIPLLAQTPPNGTVHFGKVSTQEAQAIFLAEKERLNALKMTLLKQESTRRFVLNVNGKRYDVTLDEIL